MERLEKDFEALGAGMQLIKEVITAGFESEEVNLSVYFKFDFGEHPCYQICLEPTVFNNKWYLALYRKRGISESDKGQFDLLFKKKVMLQLGFSKPE